MKIGKHNGDIRGGYRHCAVIQGWKMMVEQQQAREILADAVKQAEQNILDRIKSGQAKPLTDPFEALTALAVHTGFVINGNKPIDLSVVEMWQCQWFIVSCENYIPSSDFPYTKEEMRKALEATG